MNNMSFFDSIAEKWDQIAIHDSKKVDFIVNRADIQGNANVLDLGSGTGILIPFIKKYIGNNGNITALDISPKMIEIAKRKNGFDRITYACSDLYKHESVEKYTIIIAYSCFPHFSDHELFFNKCNELLHMNGRLVIAHSESKYKINNAHQKINSKLKSNYLMPALDVVKESNKSGFIEKSVIDSDDYYLIILEKQSEQRT